MAHNSIHLVVCADMHIWDRNLYQRTFHLVRKPKQKTMKSEISYLTRQSSSDSFKFNQSLSGIEMAEPALFFLCSLAYCTTENSINPWKLKNIRFSWQRMLSQLWSNRFESVYQQTRAKALLRLNKIDPRTGVRRRYNCVSAPFGIL